MPLLSADWGESLDPGVDERTQRRMRGDQAADAQARRIAVQRGSVPGGGGPAAVPPPDPVIVTAPSARFTVKGTLFYVMKGVDTGARPGIWGHYTVPFVTDAVSNTAKPYTEHTDNVTALDMKTGFPGVSENNLDKQPKPNATKCAEGRDFVRASSSSRFWEIGLDNVKQILEEAEAADLAFARRMEGFGNVSKDVVWNCLDPDYDPSDREAVMTQFMTKYLERFYTKMGTGNSPDVESISAEALHKHKVFCKAWTQKHYRTLTPVVTAPAESLAGEFFAYVEPLMPDLKLTRMELARVFMRHPDTAAEFASALHYFATTLEQTRGRRNANYKQMTMINSARVSSYNKLGTLLDQKGPMLTKLIKDLCIPANNLLHPLTVDWYDILGQTPPVHRYFEDTTPYQGLTAARQMNAAQGQIPPWKFR